MINRRASQAGFAVLSTDLAAALERITAINERYVIAGELDDQERAAAEDYIQGVAAVNRQARLAIRGYLQPSANPRLEGWIIEDSNVDQALQHNPPTESIGTEEGQDGGQEHNEINQRPVRGATPGDPQIDPLILDSTGGINIQNEPNEANQAKRRRIELEFELEKKRVERSRKMDDLLRQCEREEEDLKMAIERERVLAGALDGSIQGNPILSSTPKRNMDPVGNFSRPIEANEKSATFAPPSRWPKIIVERFNGDPRKWQRFANGIHATVRDANIPDSYKLLGLQDNITEDIRKRMGHIFNGSYAFESAWNELEVKYGNPGLIMQAHNQHLLQVQPFKTGDFNSLFTLAADVRDAVSSVSAEHSKEFTFSTVITSLASKLPIQLQIDWGKYAYSLRPNLPSLRDFDKWIDIAVGAEEYRGVRLSVAGDTVNKPASNIHPRQQGGYGQPGSSGYRGPTVLTNGIQEKVAAPQCPACSANPGHRLEYCNVFKKMLVNKRAALCADNNFCFKCLTQGHYGRNCSRTDVKCKDCGKAHNTLLHGADRQFPSAKSPGNESLTVLTIRAPNPNHIRPVLLAILPVTVKSNESVAETFVVLDPGSEATLITNALAETLNLSGPTFRIRFGNFNDSITIDSKVVSFRIASMNYEASISEAFLVPKISLSPRKIDWPKLKKHWAHLADLNLPAIDSSQVGVLIGADQLSAHIQKEIRESIEDGGPTAILTQFGWSVVGKIPNFLVAGPSKKLCINIQSVSHDEALCNLVEQFHSTESFGTDVYAPTITSAEDAQVIAVLESSAIFIGCGWQVDLPLRSEDFVFPNNRKQAVSRYYGMERRLSLPENQHYADKYNLIIKKLIDSGTAVKVNSSAINQPEGMIWYLPHHFVENPNKPGKIRVVMDCAASFCQVSLNTQLFRGPPLLPKLVGVLLRSRECSFALSADISAFYHRINVPSKHQSLQRFVFREFGSNKPLQTYQMTTLVFGAVHASTAAIWTLQHAVSQNKNYPEVASRIKQNFYADNLSDSFDTEMEAIKFAKDVTESLAIGGFKLTGFASSSKRVLETIPAEDRAGSILDLNYGALPTEYILGLAWDCNSDCYKLRVKELPPIMTKRELLSAMSREFDPLGICLPVITYAKLLFQETCKLRTRIPPYKKPIGWDEPLPDCILEKWNIWAGSLSSLSQISIRRCFRSSDEKLADCTSDLIVFSDSSLLAFGAVAYLKTTCHGKMHLDFVMAKGRIAPTSILSIPRLELQAAVLAIRMTQSIIREMRIPISSIEYRTDSEIVLHQINSSHHKHPTFVANRIGEILRHSSPEQWKFISGKDNPADDCTRGIIPDCFKSNSRWLTGPTQSQLSSAQVLTASLNQAEDPDPFVALSVCALDLSSLPVKTSLPAVSKLIADSQDGLARLKRDVALSLRKGANLELPITDDELKQAMRTCIIVATEEAFPREIIALRSGKLIPRDSVLRNVSPYIDPADGLMKVDGRLKHAKLPQHARQPVILPSDHRLTSLIIADAHNEINHAGVEHTLSIVRRKYYLTKGRRSIRKTLARCVKCRRRCAQPQPPIMASLPKERLLPFVRPFSTSGLDFFGPFNTVIGRRTEKRYGLLITCFSTRAVHLELVYSLSADSFLMALRRFIADRGHPTIIYSDNGTNLVAGERELREGIVNLNSKLVTEEMIDRGINWKFSPPSGPHFGGSWERLVGSSKKSLRAVLEERSVNDEVLLTVLKEVASLLNTRPLTHVSSDPSEPEPLTPNHFILGCHHPHHPPDVEEAFCGSTRRRYRQSQFIVNQYWRRWMREYVPNLIDRKKWNQATPSLRVGNRVLIMDENTRRGQWLTGTVSKLFPGDDGRVRRVSVKTATSELTRPVVKLCLFSDA